MDRELDAECALLDAIINKWSSEQAQATMQRIKGATQTTIAKELGISQPAVRFRLQGAGSWAIESLIKRFSQQININIKSGAYNPQL